MSSCHAHFNRKKRNDKMKRKKESRYEAISAIQTLSREVTEPRRCQT